MTELLLILGVLAAAGWGVAAHLRLKSVLKTSDERYRLALEASDEGHFDINVDTDEIFTSARYNVIHGFAPEARFRTRADLVRQTRYFGDDFKKYLAVIKAVVAENAPERVQFEYRVVWPSGEVHWVRVFCKSSRDATGRVRRRTGVAVDVTEEKRAEEALRLAVERDSIALAVAHEGNWDWNLQTDEFFASPQTLKVYGLPAEAKFRTQAEAVAITRVHPEDRRRVAEEWRDALKEGSKKSALEYRVLVGDEIRWVQTRWRIFRDAAGVALRAMGVVADITGRKLAEDALRESEERFRSIVRAAKVSIWEEDFTDVLPAIDELRAAGVTDWRSYFARHPELVRELVGKVRIVDVNDATLEMFGARDKSELLASLHSIFLPETESVFAEELVAIAEGRASFESEVALRTLQGERRDTLLTMAFPPDGSRFDRVPVTLVNITERKLAEEARRLSEERYKLAMVAAGDGHTDWDLRTGEHYISPRLLEICGHPPHATFRDRAEWVRRFPFHPEDRPRWEQAVAAHFAGRESHFQMELRIVVRGEVRWTAFHFLSTRDAAGKPIRWTGSIGDITEQKQAEVALRESEERYVLAMAASESGYWDWHIPTGVYFSSARASEMVGLPAENTYTDRNDFRARIPVHPEDWAKWDAAREELFAGTGERLAMEVRYIIDGETRWHSFQAICKRDEAGNVVRWTGSTTDVTERKRAEEALRNSEQSYALAMEAAQDSHWDWNMVTGEYYVSPRTIQLLGFAEGTKITSREEHLAISPYLPEEAEAWARATEELFAGTGERLSMEQRALIRGEIRWLQRTGVCKRDAAGKPIRWSGTVRDVTDRKRSEEALHASVERHALAMKASEAGYWDWNLATGEYYVSDRLLEIARLPTDTSFESRADSLARMPLHPEDKKKWAEAVQALFAGKGDRLQMDLRSVFPGEVRWSHLHGLCVRDDSGRVVRWSGSSTDITERKRIEEELRSRQEMLDVAQKSARVTAFEWRGNAAKGVNVWPPDLEAMHGLEPGGYDGTIKGWKKLIHPEDLAGVNEAMARAERTGDIALEYRVVHPDHSVHWVQTRGRMFINADGRTARIVGFAQEITQSKRAEADLRKMEQELRRAQRLEAMGTLAGGIAHDFNNILGGILGYGEMAMRYAKKGTHLRHDLTSIMAAGERGRALVDRILAFSRSGVAEQVPVHVEEVVREALDQVAASLPDDVTVMPRLRVGRAAILGDPTQVHQVVMNLAMNAAQAMPEGGSLRVWLELQRIDAARAALVGRVEPGEHVVLKVADAGTGIRPGVMERMFDPFFTTKGVGVGSGLGLSLVHGIVTRMGGAIDVKTEIGRGTTFTVYLARSGDAPEKLADENRPLARGDGQRVLVVDDEESLVHLATKTLRELGYAPTGFTSSAEALAAFRADPARFDAVLTDERMPGMSGSALIREVRRIRGEVRVVLMSGYLGMKSVEADVVVRKPLSARDLASSMARALHQ